MTTMTAEMNAITTRTSTSSRVERLPVPDPPSGGG
jgi:hypothetical protein